MRKRETEDRGDGKKKTKEGRRKKREIGGENAERRGERIQGKGKKEGPSVKVKGV